jgi:hypothetical protein
LDYKRLWLELCFSRIRKDPNCDLYWTPDGMSCSCNKTGTFALMRYWIVPDVSWCPSISLTSCFNDQFKSKTLILKCQFVTYVYCLKKTFVVICICKIFNSIHFVITNSDQLHVQWMLSICYLTNKWNKFEEKTNENEELEGGKNKEEVFVSGCFSPGMGSLFIKITFSVQKFTL